MTSVLEWGEKTTGTEVADHFKDFIRNKNGMSPIQSLEV